MESQSTPFEPVLSRRTVLAATTAAAATALIPAFASAQSAPGTSNARTTTTPRVTLNNGVTMPTLGFGTFGIAPEQAAQAVSTAIGTGFRLIDTAANYSNEAEVGEGIIRSGVARDELFVTTKLWIEQFGYDEALRAFDVSMGKLKLDYLDLYLLHWPVPSEFEKTIAAYKALEKLHADGRIRAIGVSNFNPGHLDTLRARTTIVPAVNQIEINPLFSQQNLRAENARRGIVTESWSPLGGARKVARMLQIPQIVDVAKRHGKLPVQVVIRWHLQNGLVVIPRSTNAQHIAQDFDVFDFELSDADMATIDSINLNERGGPDPETFDVAAFRELVARGGRR